MDLSLNTETKSLLNAPNTNKVNDNVGERIFDDSFAHISEIVLLV